MKGLIPCKPMEALCLAMLGMSSAQSALTYKMLFLAPFAVDGLSFNAENWRQQNGLQCQQLQWDLSATEILVHADSYWSKCSCVGERVITGKCQHRIVREQMKLPGSPGYVSFGTDF